MKPATGAVRGEDQTAVVHLHVVRTPTLLHVVVAVFVPNSPPSLVSAFEQVGTVTQRE
jgi:hypothetical protein